MKKLFALILAVVMIATMSVTAFAANTEGGSTELSFNVDPTYTVTIPAKVELQKIDTDGTITASSHAVDHGMDCLDDRAAQGRFGTGAVLGGYLDLFTGQLIKRLRQCSGVVEEVVHRCSTHV